jgi:hypothetical protein
MNQRRKLTWHNQSGDQRCHPRRIEHPKTTAEIVQFVP